MNVRLEPDFRGRTEEGFARELDAVDSLRAYRQRFHLPVGPDGRELAYLCGNSLGLMPRASRVAVEQELRRWAEMGVAGWFDGPSPWFDCDQRDREALGRLVGGLRHEVVAMNALTVNLHLMLATFYRPSSARHLVLVDAPMFPSDRYAVASHLRHRGIDPEPATVRLSPRPGESFLREEDLEDALLERGGAIALVLVSGVNYLTGHAFDLERVAEATRRAGCILGLDLAHAVGNVPLRLHEWGVDFAVWCHYKYVNAGPGAPGGCFVHERHSRDVTLPRMGGWWGNDPETRFEMRPRFEPRPDALGWQISSPVVLANATLGPALELFEEVGIERLREKSIRLTGYLESLLKELVGESVEMLTPREAMRRGCQLSVRIGEPGVERALATAGVVCDVREPDVVRLAPAPLYNSFHDVWRGAKAVAEFLGTGRE